MKGKGGKKLSARGVEDEDASTPEKSVALVDLPSALARASISDHAVALVNLKHHKIVGTDTEKKKPVTSKKQYRLINKNGGQENVDPWSYDDSWKGTVSKEDSPLDDVTTDWSLFFPAQHVVESKDTTSGTIDDVPIKEEFDEEAFFQAVLDDYTARQGKEEV